MRLSFAAQINDNTEAIILSLHDRLTQEEIEPMLDDIKENINKALTNAGLSRLIGKVIILTGLDVTIVNRKET